MIWCLSATVQTVSDHVGEQSLGVGGRRHCAVEGLTDRSHQLVPWFDRLVDLSTALEATLIGDGDENAGFRLRLRHRAATLLAARGSPENTHLVRQIPGSGLCVPQMVDRKMAVTDQPRFPLPPATPQAFPSGCGHMTRGRPGHSGEETCLTTPRMRVKDHYVDMLRIVNAESDYEKQISDLVSSWREDIYDGFLVDHVLPAVRIYAHASLQEVTDEYDVPSTFPMFATTMGLSDQYGNAIFARLSSACTSIRNALQSIQSRMDCHAAIAIARRAHESLWQMFWLCNPTQDGNTRIRRLLLLTNHEIKEARNVFSNGLNPEIAGKLRDYQSNIQEITGKGSYSSWMGRTEYESYFADPPLLGMSPESLLMDDGVLAWRTMCNMTHPNVVFDWILQTQSDFQNRMNRLQLMPTASAMRAVANLSTLLMRQAQLPVEQIMEVHTLLKRSVASAELLIGLQRD